ncbi:hypothetical protein Tco_0375366 [Tanacetum coccineum]
MFDREKLSRTNLNDWFRSLKLVLRVEKKLFVIKQPIFPAPPADSTAQVLAQWNAVYDALMRLLVLCSKGYVEQPEGLGYVLPQDLSVGLIMASLYEKGLPKKADTPQVMAIQGGRIQKANKKSLNAKGKGKGKGKSKDKSYIPKPKNLKPYTKEHLTMDDACHHCKEVGHCKRNCHAYLAELIRKKKQVGTASSSEERKLKQGALYLCVGNGVHAQVEAIGRYDLVLPSVLVIFLDNYHYAPSITRGVASISHLVDNGFTQCFTDYEISVSKNNVLYFNTIPSDGIYEIDMLNLVSNVNSIYNDSYFITFTDDYSHYDYMYLLKHKHEVFETFKVFKNEVGNQLEKTIKALRSHRGGE